ncbi:hypothetical protein [Roseovarius sp. Pro17]|nr:hypothetical protein [Roseovarius sp. Pro17]
MPHPGVLEKVAQLRSARLMLALADLFDQLGADGGQITPMGFLASRNA